MDLRRTPESVSLTVLGLAVGLLACSGSEPESREGTTPDFPSVKGWSQVGEVLTYDADNLWEYINGAAELFVEFGVQTCRTADLVSGDLAVTVDLYDMGTPLNAFGVYEREKPGDDIPVPGATAGVVSAPYQALLLKGSTYVKVNTFEGELTGESGLRLLEALAESLPGEAGRPPELNLLPTDGKIPGTEGYKPLAFLGRAELTDCLYAEYSLAGEESWQGFVVLPTAALSVWEGLSEGWDSVELAGETVFFTEVPYSGFVGIVRRGDRVFGVAEALDQAQMLARLQAFEE
jgi:hypothetical protein